MKYHESRKMLLDGAQREHVVRELANSCGWRFQHEVRDFRVRELTWDAGRDRQVYYLEEPRSQGCFVQVDGPDQAAVDEIANILETRLVPIPEDEVFRRVDDASCPEQRAQAVMQMGLVAPRQWEPDTYSRINAALYADEPQVRSAALAAVAYSHWPQWRSLVEYMSYTDPDPMVRRDAEILFDVAYKQAAS